jgi:hypothetical protein
MYAPDEQVIVRQSLIHQIEDIYFSFQKHLQSMHLNTNCQCKACINTNKLDLKFFVHFGEYELQKVGDREELIGTDVILIHRLMKNDVVEKTGIHAYALFTKKASDQLGLNKYCDSLVDHIEEISNIGEINITVFSLKKAWEKFLNSKNDQVIVDPNENFVTVEFDILAPPSVVWNYLISPDLKKQWLQMTEVIHITASTKKSKKGAHKTYGKGSEYHCAQGTGDFQYKVMDWRPFHYFTVEGVNAVFRFRQTYILEPTEFGCRYIVRLIPHSTGAIRSYFNRRKAMKVQEMFQQFYNECHPQLADFILKHQKKVKVTTD